MGKERAIELQLVKPVDMKSSGGKGKISLRNIFKEQLENLQVPFADPCCGDSGGESGVPCPAISEDLGNSIECRDDGLFSANIDPSADPASRFLLTEVNNVFTFDGPKMRDINNKNEVLIYRMPSGNLSSDYDDMVYNDAMITAGIGLATFDIVTVAGSTNASYVRFVRQITLNRVTFKLKIRIDALGATAPLAGFIGVWPAPVNVFSNFNNSMFRGHINLLTGVVTDATAGTGAVFTYNGWNSAAVVGDVIEMEYSIDYLKGTLFTAYKSNGTTGEMSVNRHTRTDLSVPNSMSTHQHPAIVLADGTYVILSYEIIGKDLNPKILVVGDSMASGNEILFEDSIIGSFEAKVPYRAASIAAPATLLSGMEATIYQIRTLLPEYVLISNYLDPLFTFKAANPADPDYAAWDIKFKHYVNTIKAMGVKVIFMHPETWTFLANATDCAYFTTYLNTEFPTDFKVYIPNSQIVYDSTTFHYAGPTNRWIADQVIAYLETQGEL